MHAQFRAHKFCCIVTELAKFYRQLSNRGNTRAPTQCLKTGMIVPFNAAASVNESLLELISNCGDDRTRYSTYVAQCNLSKNVF
mmetsp:Transcript_103350/g.280806  ORF Transcript_103350/g.280806 Transcript_103350/m.280806 type:complete len:84 (-) Transcript_103350:549-800(-)